MHSLARALAAHTTSHCSRVGGRAWFILRKAWFAAPRLQPDMYPADCVAVVGAMAIVEWFETATVRFARIYTPAVLVIAVVVLFAPPLMFGGAWMPWMCRALSCL